MRLFEEPVAVPSAEAAAGGGAAAAAAPPAGAAPQHNVDSSSSDSDSLYPATHALRLRSWSFRD